MDGRARGRPLLAGAALLLATACGGPDPATAGAARGGTCAPIAGERLVVLEDDKRLQDAENVVPVVNAATAMASPALLPALDGVSAALTAEELVGLHAAVDVEGRSAREVARGWVQATGVAEDLGQDLAQDHERGGPVVVGAASAPGSRVLAEVYAAALSAAGFPATVREVGRREHYLPALQSGVDVQVVPEYLGTVADAIDRQVNGAEAEGVATDDPASTLSALRPLAEQVGLVFGTPAPAADQDAFAVTSQLADALGVASLSELADACTDGSLVLGGPADCPERPQCRPGLEETYGLMFARFHELDDGGPRTKAAIRRGEVSLGLVSSADGELAGN